MAEAADPDSRVSEDLSSELKVLGSIFDGEGEFIVTVKELSAGGTYCYVVQVKPKGLAVGLQFALPANYPETSPKVEILPRIGEADTLDDDPLLTELLQFLYQSAQESIGKPVMYSLVGAAKEWLEERSIGKAEEEDDNDDEVDKEAASQNLKPGHKSSKSLSKLEDDEGQVYQKKGEKKKKKKKQPDEEQDPGKKPRMKTASEVISRIHWDKQIRQEDFIVGYLDRFVGIVEKPFTAFSWVDIATVDDYTTLAIPRHRIQYFKYKDQIVWDKNQRLDNVFGSTGSNKTILDAVEMFSKENRSEEEKEASDAGEKAMEELVQDLSVDVGASSQRKKKQRPSRGPNYFFAIRIIDPVILRCMSRIQDAICEDDPRLEDICTDLSRLHITLCTMRLDNQDDMCKAVNVLKSLQEEISSLLSPVTILRFQGLGQFHNRILYSAPEESPALMKLVHTLKTGLRDAGINLVGNFPKFTPHMTIMKMDRQTASDAFHGMPIHMELYERFIEAFIGVQPVDAIHLCSMTDPARADGFYYCLTSMDIQSED